MEEASVAGESPDRSKQRESSAEPTSGSAGSVPEARDPRLAVAREKDSSSGGTDTTTKVLSVRDVKRRTATTEPTQADAPPEVETADAEPQETPKEDAALREAVSAWVRGAATDADAEKRRQEPDATANTPEPATNTDAGSKADAGSRAEVDEKADADSKAEVEEKADADSKADAGSRAEVDEKADADSKAEVEEKADADSK
ncbi:D-alanyl-D-alanine carboxypeptidase, partial [Streptomyces sp. NPDC048521]